MIKKSKTVTVLCAASLTLAACGATTGSGRSGPVSAGLRPATSDYRSGAAGAQAQPHGPLIGRDRAALIGQFGQPRLETAEGVARALQFASDRCVLDIYLYPPRNGGEPVAAHVDARAPDGSSVEAEGCINALRRR